MKITVNYDSNRNVVPAEHAWSTETYDLEDIDTSAAQRLCSAVNEDNITVLGNAETEDELKQLFEDFVINSLGEEVDDVKPDSFNFTGPDMYVVEGIAAGYYAVLDFASCIDNEFEFMPEEYKKMYEFEEVEYAH